MVRRCFRAALIGMCLLAAGGCPPSASDVRVSTIAITAPDKGPINQQAVVTFRVTFDQFVSGFDDPQADVQLQHNGTSGGRIAIRAVDGQTYTVTVTDVSGDGSYMLIVPAGAAQDSLGNTSPGGTSEAVAIDNTPPVITVSTITNNRRQPLLRGTLDDAAATVTARIADSPLGKAGSIDAGTWTLVSGVDVPDGTHEVIATACDAAGNCAQASYTLTLDATAPRVTVDPLAIIDPTPPLSGTIDDPAATILVRVAGQTYDVSQQAGRWTLPDNRIQPPLSPGKYDVIATAMDTFGNVGQDATTNELRITDAPLVDTVTLADDNLSMLITLDQPVYADTAHSQPIGLSSLRSTYTRCDDLVSDVVMTGISNADGGSLLGATRIRVNLALIGGPTLGLGFVHIEAVDDAIWNAQGQLAIRLSTGYLRLHDPRNLLNAYEWSFDKFLDTSANPNWHAVNAVGVMAPVHGGQRSALFADPTSRFEDRGITMPDDSTAAEYIDVVPQGLYKISTWVYIKSNTTGGPADTGIRLQLKMDRAGQAALLDGATLQAASMNTWQVLETTVRAPASAGGHAWMVVQAADLKANDSDVYVDDFRVTHE